MLSVCSQRAGDGDGGEDMHVSSERAALAWIAGGLGWIVTLQVGLRATEGTGGFYATEVALLPVHGLVLAGIIGLWRSDATGDAPWGRRGLGLAAFGRVAFIGLEIGSIIQGSDDLPFPIAVVLTGVGMLVAGAAIARAGRWRGWTRWTPLAMGAYPFLVIVPVFAATGERPADALVAGWGLAIVAVGVAMRHASRQTQLHRSDTELQHLLTTGRPNQ